MEYQLFAPVSLGAMYSVYGEDMRIWLSFEWKVCPNGEEFDLILDFP